MGTISNWKKCLGSQVALGRAVASRREGPFVLLHKATILLLAFAGLSLQLGSVAQAGGGPSRMASTLPASRDATAVNDSDGCPQQEAWEPAFMRQMRITDSESQSVMGMHSAEFLQHWHALNAAAREGSLEHLTALMEGDYGRAFFSVESGQKISADEIFFAYFADRQGDLLHQDQPARIKLAAKLLFRAAANRDPKVFLYLVDHLIKPAVIKPNLATADPHQHGQARLGAALLLGPVYRNKPDLIAALAQQGFPVDYPPPADFQAIASKAQPGPEKSIAPAAIVEKYLRTLRSPLLVAIDLAEPSAAESLLRHGAKVNGSDLEAATVIDLHSFPLGAALEGLERYQNFSIAKKGALEILTLLQKYGVNLTPPMADVYLDESSRFVHGKNPCSLLDWLIRGVLLDSIRGDLLSSRGTLNKNSGLTWMIDQRHATFDPFEARSVSKLLFGRHDQRLSRIGSLPSSLLSIVAINSQPLTEAHPETPLAALVRYFQSPAGVKKLKEELAVGREELSPAYLSKLEGLGQFVRKIPEALQPPEYQKECLAMVAVLARKVQAAHTLKQFEELEYWMKQITSSSPESFPEVRNRLLPELRARRAALVQEVVASLESAAQHSEVRPSEAAVKLKQFLQEGPVTALSADERVVIKESLKQIFNRVMVFPRGITSVEHYQVPEQRAMAWAEELHALGLGFPPPGKMRDEFIRMKKLFLLGQQHKAGAPFTRPALGPKLGDCLACGEKAMVSCSAGQADCQVRLCAACKTGQMESLLRDEFGAERRRDPWCLGCKQPVRIAAFPASSPALPVPADPTHPANAREEQRYRTQLAELHLLAHRAHQTQQDPHWRPCPTFDCPDGKSIQPGSPAHMQCRCCDFKGCLDCEMDHGTQDYHPLTGACLKAPNTLSEKEQRLAIRQGERAPIALASLEGPFGDRFRGLSEDQERPKAAASLLSQYLGALTDEHPGAGHACPVCQKPVGVAATAEDPGEALAEGEGHQIRDHFLDGRARPCPHCGLMVEKTPLQEGGGCNHMICPNSHCGKDFNFNLGKKAAFEHSRSQEAKQYKLAPGLHPWWRK